MFVYTKGIPTTMRRDTRDKWLEINPVLRFREIVHEQDTDRLKVGDGVSTYSELPYWRSEGG